MKNISRTTWYVIVGILAVPALFVHLGMVPFIEDESIRALVALEMRLKADYLVPTLNDSLYFAKPPLYNWILNAFYSLTGEISEWSSRLPTVVAAIAMSLLVYRSSKPYFKDRHTAILAGLMWPTCGRVLFYDSFLGLIDIAYSLVVYGLFIVVWQYGREHRWLSLYAGAYLLAAIAYLLKGIPIIVFLPCTFLAFAWVHRSWRWLIQPAHLVGLAIGVAIVGGYYYLYAEAAPVSRSLGGLSQQATMRTPLSHDVVAVISHVFTYPFEYIYHYLPWTLFLLLLIRRDVMKRLRDQPFFHYAAVLFMANILVYWISPGTYARYVLMLIPLSYLVALFFYEKEKEEKTWRIWLLSKLILLVVVVLPLVALGALWHPAVEEPHVQKTWVWIVGILLAIFAGYYVYQQQHRPIILVAILLTLRVGLNVVVLPSRAATTYSAVAKADAIRIGERYMDEDIRLYQGSRLDYTSSFYLANTRQKLTVRDYDALEEDVLYIIDTARYEIPVHLHVIDSIRKREARHTLFLAKM